RNPWVRGRRPWKWCPWVRPRVRAQPLECLRSNTMTCQQTGQPSRLGSAPAAFGREPEIVDELLRDGDARFVPRLVGMVEQAEIELGAGRPLPVFQRRVEGVVDTLL